MAKTDSGLQRISQLIPKEQVAVPSIKSSDAVGKDYALTSYEFKVSEKGGDFVVLQCHDLATRKDVEITCWDRAIIAQIAALPEGTALPIAVKVVKFGNYYALD